jgi:hypothetical protein
MAISTLPADAPARELLRENTHPLVNLEANSLTVGFASPFTLLQDELLVSLSDENKLLLEIARAEARAMMLDAQIDALVDALKHACLLLTDGSTKIAPYTTYFDKKKPAEVMEPLLDEELVITESWLTSLGDSPHVSLNDIGVKLAPLIQLGDPAMKAMRDANQALLDFYETGTRFTLVQKMNSARKLTYGLLGQLVHDHPELGLTVNFPDTFFFHDTRKRKKETPASIDGEIATLKKKIAALEIKRDKLAAVLAAGKTASAKKKSSKLADDIAKAEQAEKDAADKLAQLKAEKDAEDAAAGP